MTSNVMHKNKILSLRHAFKNGWDQNMSNVWMYSFYAGIFMIATILAGQIPHVGILLQIAIIVATFGAAYRFSHDDIKKLNQVSFTWRQFANIVISSALLLCVFAPLMLLIYMINVIFNNDIINSDITRSMVEGNLGFVVLAVSLFAIGAYFAVRLSYFPFAVLDLGHGPVTALKHSWHMTIGNAFRILILIAASVFILSLGLFGYVAGVFILYPVFYFTIVDTYKQLSKKV